MNGNSLDESRRANGAKNSSNQSKNLFYYPQEEDNYKNSDLSSDDEVCIYITFKTLV